MASVEVINDTTQEFNGERYWLCGYYFQRHGKRLHREVWKFYNGDIPKGFHVHHIDEDRTNNQIENLELLEGKEHLLQHAGTESRRENGRRAIKMAIEKAPEWHKSKEGYKWHSEHGKKIWENRKPHTFKCDMCGKEFESMTMTMTGRHFCHPNCKAKHLRRRRKGLA